MPLSKKILSVYRQRLQKQLHKIEQHAFFAAYPDPLIQGVASQVFRRCGKKNCKCLDDAQRHGPYLVIQLYEHKKQRQILLKKDQKPLWQQAKNYQTQLHSLLALKKACAELIDEVENILEKRLVSWGESDVKK